MFFLELENVRRVTTACSCVKRASTNVPALAPIQDVLLPHSVSACRPVPPTAGIRRR